MGEARHLCKTDNGVTASYLLPLTVPFHPCPPRHINVAACLLLKLVRRPLQSVLAPPPMAGYRSRQPCLRRPSDSKVEINPRPVVNHPPIRCTQVQAVGSALSDSPWVGRETHMRQQAHFSDFISTSTFTEHVLPVIRLNSFLPP